MILSTLEIYYPISHSYVWNTNSLSSFIHSKESFPHLGNNKKVVCFHLGQEQTWLKWKWCDDQRMPFQNVYVKEVTFMQFEIITSTASTKVWHKVNFKRRWKPILFKSLNASFNSQVCHSCLSRQKRVCQNKSTSNCADESPDFITEVF